MERLFWLRVVLQTGKGGCPGRTGRMPGCLPASGTPILAPCPPAGSREQESLFCLGINWTGCGKIGRQAGRLPKLKRACFLHRAAHEVDNAATFPPYCPYPTVPSFSFGPDLTLLFQLSLRGSLSMEGPYTGSTLCFPGWALEKLSGTLVLRKLAEGEGTSQVSTVRETQA